MTGRLIGRWRRRVARPGSKDLVLGRRLNALETRVKHQEAELEGLQDAVYRQAVIEHRNIDELRQRMDPAQIARDLSEDARRRGL